MENLFWEKSACGDYRCCFKTNCHVCCTCYKIPCLDEFVIQHTSSLLYEGVTINASVHCQSFLFWVCVFFFLLNHFTVLILITTICLCAKREIISFLVTKADSEVWFHWLRGIATVAVWFSGNNYNLYISTFFSTFCPFSQNDWFFFLMWSWYSFVL